MAEISLFLRVLAVKSVNFLYDADINPLKTIIPSGDRLVRFVHLQLIQIDYNYPQKGAALWLKQDADG